MHLDSLASVPASFQLPTMKTEVDHLTMDRRAVQDDAVLFEKRDPAGGTITAEKTVDRTAVMNKVTMKGGKKWEKRLKAIVKVDGGDAARKELEKYEKKNKKQDRKDHVEAWEKLVKAKEDRLESYWGGEGSSS